MKYIVAQEVKSKTKVSKNIYLFDFFFILVYFSISLILGIAVHENLKILFYVFSGVCALYLTTNSRTNRGRRNYESILLFLRRDRDVYLPVPNQSKRRKKGAEQ